MNPSSGLRLEADVRRYAALLDVTDVVSLHYEPSELFRHLTLCLQSVVSFDLINFALYDPLRNVMLHHLWDGQDWPETPIEMGLDEAASGWVWDHQTPLAIDDLERDTRYPASFAWLHTFDLRSYCVFPLTAPHERLGALGFGSKRVRAFSPQDVEFLKRVAEIVALGVDNSRARTCLTDEKERLQLLLELETPQMPSLDLQENISSFLMRIQKWARQDYVSLYLYNQSSGSLRQHMPDPQVISGISPEGGLPLEGSLTGQAFRSGKVEIHNHADLSRVSFDSVRRGLQLGVKSLCLIPLLGAERPFGVLKVAGKSDHAFTSRDVELLTKVVGTLAPALEQTLIQESLPENQQAIHVETGAIASLGLQATQPGGSADPDGLISFANQKLFEEPEQLISAYFSASTVGLCIVDTELRFLAVNRALAEINGLNAEAHLGKTVREVVGEVADKTEAMLRHVLATGQPVLNFEVSARLPTRNEVGHWTANYFPIKDAHGWVKQIGIVVVETTKQKKLEASLHELSDKLRQEKRRLEVLLEVGGAMAATWNVEKVFLTISKHLRRLLHQEYASFYLYDEKNRLLLSQATDFPLGKGLLLDSGVRVDVDHSPLGKALLARTPLIFSRAEIAAFQTDFTSELVQEGIKTSCCVPLVAPKGMLGTLHLGSTRRDAFTADDLTLLGQVASLVAIALENASAAQQIEELKNRLEEEKKFVEGEVRTAPQFEELVGESSALKRVLREVSTVAASGATVLILGETGTGKELIARAIHRMSQRNGQSFIKVNCAAIPTGLLESELFGHEKGAFTGAVSQKVGRMELANHGTLFLDEVGEIPLELQPKLLRVLQDQEFERLGSTKTIKVNVRLLAATNRELSRSVSEHEFRSDLFYRLNVFPIRVPPLRERPEDIPLLVRHFVHKYALRMQRQIESISTKTMNALVAWSWPGNVRELENIIERSVILSESSALHVPVGELRAEEEDHAANSDSTLENAEREHIIRVLRETGGVLSGPGGAAHRLGLKRTTLQSKMHRLKMNREDYLGSKHS